MVIYFVLFALLLSSHTNAGGALNTRINNDVYGHTGVLSRFVNQNHQIYPLRKSQIEHSLLYSEVSRDTSFLLSYRSGDYFNAGLSIATGGNLIKTNAYKGIHTYYYGYLAGRAGIMDVEVAFRDNVLNLDTAIIPRWHRENYTGPFYNIGSKDRYLAYGNRKSFFSNRFNLVLDFGRAGFFEAGHSAISMGPSFFDNLALGDSTHSYDYLMYENSIGPFSLTSGLLFLISDFDFIPKNLAFHRLETSLGEHFRLGLYETVVFRNRIPLMYVFPLVPYFFAEHNYGDQDNSTLGADLIFSYRGFRTHFSLFIDDLHSPSPQSFFDDSWWGNKWAYNVGVGYMHTFNNSFYALLATEYSRIEPWVYTHHLDSGVLRYTHYGRLLGASPGSDSHRFRVLVQAGFFSLFSTEIMYDYYEKGPIDNFLIHDYDIHGEGKTFLEEMVRTRSALSGKIRYIAHNGRLKITPWVKGYFMLNNNEYSGSFGLEIRY